MDSLRFDFKKDGVIIKTKNSINCFEYNDILRITSPEIKFNKESNNYSLHFDIQMKNGEIKTFNYEKPEMTKELKFLKSFWQKQIGSFILTFERWKRK